MATYTSKLNLKKPEGNELFNRVQDLNDNWDKIDAIDSSDITFTPTGNLSSTNVQTALAELDTKKVDKVTGKGLSTNDYTTIEKSKVANLPDDTNAQLTKNINASNKILNFNGYKFLGHRGLMHYGPENSIPSVEAAGEFGYWATETDIIPSIDGYYMCIHDDTLDRTTNGTGNVREMTLAQIRAFNIDFGSNLNPYLTTNFSQFFQNLKVPTLDEWIAVCKKYKIIPFMEVKLYTSDERIAFYEKLKYLSITNECLILQSDKNALNHYRQLDSNIALGLNGDVTTDNINYVKSLGNAFINASTLTQEQVDLCHTNGLKVGVWGVNSSNDLNKWIKYGVDILTSDYLID